jgi:hypothetical protein
VKKKQVERRIGLACIFTTPAVYGDGDPECYEGN